MADRYVHTRGECVRSFSNPDTGNGVPMPEMRLMLVLLALVLPGTSLFLLACSGNGSIGTSIPAPTSNRNTYSGLHADSRSRIVRNTTSTPIATSTPIVAPTPTETPIAPSTPIGPAPCSLESLRLRVGRLITMENMRTVSITLRVGHQVTLNLTNH